MGTDHCGDSCSPCPATHGAATCDGTSCGLQCDDGYHLEGSNCVVDCTDASCEPLQWCSESGACVQCIDPSGQSEPNDTLETADMMTFVNAANYQGQGRSCGSGDVDVWRVNLTYEPGEQVSWGFQATGDGAWWVEIYDGTNHLITDLCTVEDNCNVNIAFDNVIPNFNGPLYILVEHAGGTVPLDYWVYAYQG
jgi:hypothetical protein